ncbi:MAG: tetratricopeptide repeat protein [Desulfobacterales bacterium]|nr:MAG: tetratricopeptide repeat protein [Desulfobacterales bacterium]
MPQSTKRLMGVLSFLVISFAFLMAVEKVQDYDIWWHLKTGQWILETGKIPKTDPFTFTTPDAAWAPHYWLADVLFAIVLRISGLDGLILFKAFVVSAAFAIIFRLMLRQGVNLLVAVTLVLLAVFIGHFRFLLRPHVFMFLLSAAFFWMLSVWGGARNLKLLWLLPLMVLWVNLHGSFFFGLVLTGCLLVEEWLTAGYRRIRKKEAITSWPTFSMLVFVLLGGITLVNPFGIDLLQWIVADFVLKSVSYTFEVEEHMALTWGTHRLFWSLMIAVAASFPLALRKARLFHLLVFAATSFLAIKGVRFVALAAILQAPILGYNLQALLDKIPAQKWRLTRSLQAALAILLLVAGGTLILKRSFADYTDHRFGLGINESHFPEAAVQFLRELNPQGNIYNSWPIGGYLLWALPERKIFLDGRYLDAQLELIAQLNTMTARELQALFNRFDIRAAIVTRKDKRLAAYFSQANDFRLAYFDDQALLYLGDDALPAKTMEGFAFLALVHPESPDASYLSEYARSPMAPMVENELRHAVTLAPHSFQTHFLLAFFLEVAGRGAEALEQYLLAVRANPRLAFVHYDLGRRGGNLAVRLKEWDKMTALIKQAMRFRKDDELLFLLATSLYQSGHHAEAEKAYLEILRRQPQQVASLVNLGYLYLDSQRFQKAEEMQRRALNASSDNEVALFGLALALQRGGKTEEASRTWQEFLEKHPQSPWRKKAQTHLDQLRSPHAGNN